MPAPQRIKELVENFKANFEHVQSNGYKEEDLRNHYLNPFFQELGWDMEDKVGKGPLRDLHYEKTIKSGAPDYGFYTDGKLRFFVEAKNPSKNVCNDPPAALQLRGYGWSAKTVLGILTDFEELSIYDTTVRPKAADQARVARLDCIKYTEFVERWDEIYALFSREAVMGGSLEKLEKKRAKDAVDDGLLEDISSWRELLAKNIANRNDVSEERLNRIVQDTIGRLLFLRICEDRGIAQEGDLRDVAEGDGNYAKLYKLFKKAEQRYDSDLFEVASISDLVVDDKVLKEIISELYFPKSPYKFDAIPAEILGQVYEQFLGKVIRLTEGGHAKVEEKPEVRKAGGIYYTPAYIVEYIVRNTVGKLVEGLTPKKIETLTIVDPACGSGSFLLGAYKFLVDWYRDWYVSDDATKHQKAKKIYLDSEKQWQLTLDERKRILTANIYGVDLDRQAVEMAKLSLMLEALRAPEQQSLFNDRMLPRMGNNIKCGNALISIDYLAGQLVTDAAEMARTNPFDWKTEFADVFNRGGFDAVIGNPPYISYSGRQAEELSESVQKYFEEHFAAMEWPNAHSLFIEKSVRTLSRKFTAFIVPDQLGHLDGYRTIRKIIFENAGIKDVKYWGENVFEDAVTPALTLVVEKGFKGETTITPFNQPEQRVRLSATSTWRVASPHQALLDRITKGSKSLGDLVADPGVHTGNCSEKIILEKPIGKSVPVLEGKQINRYSCSKPKKFLRLNYRPVQGEYFTFRDEKKYKDAKFLIRQTAAFPIVGPRVGAVYFRNSLLALFEPKDNIDIRYLVGLLNSRFLRWVYRTNVQESGQKAFPQVKIKNLRELPIRYAKTEIHNDLVSLVTRMLTLNVTLQEVYEESQRLTLSRQLEATDRQIDQLVYKLYGLTDEEIRIVEEATK